MSNELFISKLADAIGEDFMLSDMLYQDELFAKQELISKILVDAANKNNELASLFIRRMPRCFHFENKKIK